MPASLAELFHRRRPALPPGDPDYVPRLVDEIIAAAREAGASDVHLVPEADGLRMSWRIDGVLQTVASFPRELRANVVSRLKVLAELLTYRTDVPQEGRIRAHEAAPSAAEAGGLPREDVEMRVSTFPTLYGEKCVVRLFVGSGRFRWLDDLGYPDDVAAETKSQQPHSTNHPPLSAGVIR